MHDTVYTYMTQSIHAWHSLYIWHSLCIHDTIDTYMTQSIHTCHSLCIHDTIYACMTQYIQDVRLEYGRTFVLSNFQCCPLVWYFCSRHDVLALEQIQKRMLRMVLEDYESSYEDLLSKCGMSMLEIQRARTLAIEVYKSIDQMTPIYIQEMFNAKITPYDFRDPWQRPKQQHMVLNPLHMKEIASGTLCLYILPVHIKGAESLGIFKDRINKWQPKFLNRL